MCFSDFVRAEQGDFDFRIFLKSGFAPSIWHLNAKYSQQMDVLNTFPRCIFANPQKMIFFESARQRRKVEIKR